jgi:hypothetical protein
LIREFHLSPRGKGGISCGPDGAFIGAIPILSRLRRSGKDEWRPRDCGSLCEQVSAQYGLPIDMSRKTGGLKAIARALNEGDIARAQIATVLLGVPDPLPLSKGAASRQQMIDLARDLNWSGLLKWDADQHPRWPAGSADGKGGEFAPKEGNAADVPMPDGARRNLQSEDGAPKLILAAAEVEDERDPRFGIGGNHPPVEELLPRQLVQSPAGPVVQFLDNLLDLSGPGEDANLKIAEVQMRDLLHAIREVDPDYVYESLMPEGGLAGMSWQERANVIRGLQADLAAAIYRVRGDIRPLQEVTLEFMQRATNDAYDEAVKQYNDGELDGPTPEVAIGNKMDSLVRENLRLFFDGLRIPMGPGSAIRVNRRAYDTSDWPPSYRVPDARVGNFAFDVSSEAKQPTKPQIRGFFGADFEPVGVVIVRPNQLGGKSSYIIWRTDGE